MDEYEVQSKIGAVIVGEKEGELKLVEVLGLGSFAVVYLAESLTYPTRQYAVKCLFKEGLSAAQLQLQRNEARILARLRGHRNIVSLYETIDTDDCLFLVLEKCDGDLFDAIERYGGFPDRMVRDLFGQLADAVAFAHARGVYHRDIKPENALVIYGKNQDDITIKLTDFGLSTTAMWSNEFGCGSIRYMAPECLGEDGAEQDGYATAPNDVWALGVMLINILTSQNPWVEPIATDPLYAAYTGGEPDTFKSQFGFSDELDKILHRIFDVVPSRRPTVQQFKSAVCDITRFFDVAGFDSLADKNMEWADDTSEMDYNVVPVFDDGFACDLAPAAEPVACEAPLEEEPIAAPKPADITTTIDLDAPPEITASTTEPATCDAPSTPTIKNVEPVYPVPTPGDGGEVRPHNTTQTQQPSSVPTNPTRNHRRRRNRNRRQRASVRVDTTVQVQAATVPVVPAQELAPVPATPATSSPTVPSHLLATALTTLQSLMMIWSERVQMQMAGGAEVVGGLMVCVVSV
ncbi:hypothetical protein HK104_008575 [Borealophlyctis nickersoniae]|nr:hypothetical protein HK104_008575 [Borealophlyctis nickersoniae]